MKNHASEAYKNRTSYHTLFFFCISYHSSLTSQIKCYKLLGYLKKIVVKNYRLTVYISFKVIGEGESSYLKDTVIAQGAPPEVVLTIYFPVLY